MDDNGWRAPKATNEGSLNRNRLKQWFMQSLRVFQTRADSDISSLERSESPKRRCTQTSIHNPGIFIYTAPSGIISSVSNSNKDLIEHATRLFHVYFSVYARPLSQTHLISASPFPAPLLSHHLQCQESLLAPSCPSSDIPLLSAQHLSEASRVTTAVASPSPCPPVRPSRGCGTLKRALTCMPPSKR